MLIELNHKAEVKNAVFSLDFQKSATAQNQNRFCNPWYLHWDCHHHRFRGSYDGLKLSMDQVLKTGEADFLIAEKGAADTQTSFII